MVWCNDVIIDLSYSWRITQLPYEDRRMVSMNCIDNQFIHCGWSLIVDDPMDAFPVHFGGGLVGVVTAPFLIPDGIFTRKDNASATVSFSEIKKN